MRVLLGLILLLPSCTNLTPFDPNQLSEAEYDREIERIFQYGPPEPLPVERDDLAEGHLEDARYFSAFPDYDRSYSRSARRKAHVLVAQLQRDAVSLSHEQFVLRVAEIAALADNAHTSIGHNAFKKNTPRIPVRTYLFADGLFVLRAKAGADDLLGARIDQIEGRDVSEVFERLYRYAGGTEARRKLRLLPILESPGLLHAAGVAASPSSLNVSGVLADGTAFSRELKGEERGRAAPVTSSVQLLYPTAQTHSFRSLLSMGDDVPVYLRRYESFFFGMADLPGRGLYVRIAHNNDTDDVPISEFLSDVLERVKSDDPSYLAVDLRMNGGGDYTTTYDFARALPAIASPATIYLLVSPWTFSAAITTAAALKDVGGDRVVIVGEDVGDRLDFWAEGGTFFLPNSFVSVHYSAGRHRYDGPCKDYNSCFWLNDRFPVRVQTLEPDIIAPITFEDYRSLNDPALETIIEIEASED